MMSIDILAVGAHPDDCEIFMAGTLIQMRKQGCRTAVCDLTQGEAGTYGDAKTRKKEMERASDILGLSRRVTLDLGDGRLEDNEFGRRSLVALIRELRPSLIFTFDERFTRHPDHGACARLVKKCAFVSGLEKLGEGTAHRPQALIGFPELMISRKPDWVVNVTDVWAERIEAVRCYQSQVSDPDERSTGKTFLRSHHFWELLRSRSVQAGGWGGCELAEPFYSDPVPVLTDLLKVFDRSFV